MGVLRMNQASRLLSTYTADVSGVCSALYELGGLTVMHDASGCNSTYNTHDEPRWYEQPSMVYISALTEIDAVMGADDKLIGDIVSAAEQLHPKFIAVAGTPIPMMMGTDFSGIAMEIEEKTGLPTFGLATNGMHSYLSGVEMAFLAVARRFCLPAIQKPQIGGSQPFVNLLGVTPLDFSVTGSVEALRQQFIQRGYGITSCWAMGSSLAELQQAGQAQVNAVVSQAGLALARFLKQQYGTPYLLGLPMGSRGADAYFARLGQVAKTGQDGCSYADLPQNAQGKTACVIGEAVAASSLKAALLRDGGFGQVRVACPLSADGQVLAAGDIPIEAEQELRELMLQAQVVIGDPLYRRLLPGNPGQTTFIDWPHEAYSGRIYRKQIPVLMGEQFDVWQKGWVR